MIQFVKGAEAPKKSYDVYCPQCRQRLKVVTSQPHLNRTCPNCQEEFSIIPAIPRIVQQPDLPSHIEESDRPLSGKEKVKTAFVLIVVASLCMSAFFLCVTLFMPGQNVPTTIPVSNMLAEEENNTVFENVTEDSKQELFVTDPAPSETMSVTVLDPNIGLVELPAYTKNVQPEKIVVAPPVAAPSVPNVDTDKASNPPDTQGGLQNILLGMKPIVEKVAQPVKPHPVAEIKPFGDLTWDDNPLEVILKLRKIEGLQTLRLGFVDGRGYCDINPRSTELRLRQLLRSSLMLRTCQVPGIHGYIMPNAPKITASPIGIGDGVFTLTVYFSSEPGSMIDNPNKALTQAREVFGRSADFYYPIRLKTVTLNLHGSKTVPEVGFEYVHDFEQTLNDQLSEKYSSAPSRGEGLMSQNLYWTDKVGRQVSLGNHLGRSLFLSYTNQPIDFAGQLYAHQEDLQRDQVSRAHNQRFANASDLQGKL
jgi:uncharacterized protein YbaR (Trm112 family)